MAGFSDTVENAVLDHVLGKTTYTAPATLYAALFTAAPSDSGGGTEVTGGSYARVAITNNTTNFPNASGGSKSNGTAITFPTATANWGTVTHIALLDHATNSAGSNFVATAILTASRSVVSGNIPTFAIGTLTFTQD